ncbi:putative holin-like toxin [Streptococcus mutans]|uniref:putative holin-like toxin n=1 Tax=Streptococcus mutans TaxID=1309 RepID=UPI00128C178C|nr:putative holin-like toxin [Streptococcus mutans]MCY7115587.1 putative holin-like toxin [Streptococcus mutans]
MHQNLAEKGGTLLTAFEVVQTILGFGSFTIALIGLCYKIFRDKDKNKSVPTFG